MALIEYDVYKQKLRDLEPELKKLGDALDIDAVAQEAARLEDETTQDGFWNNLERSQKVQTRLKQLQNKLHRFKKLMSTWEDLTTLCEMGQEAEDEEILEELKTEFPALETEIEELGAHIVELENEINDPEVLRDHLLLRDKCDELDDSRFHQQELYDEWEKLAEEQDRMDAERDS